VKFSWELSREILFTVLSRWKENISKIVYIYILIYIKIFCPKIIKWNFLESRLEKSYVLRSPVENKIIFENLKKLAKIFEWNFLESRLEKFYVLCSSVKNNNLENIFNNILAEISLGILAVIFSTQWNPKSTQYIYVFLFS